MKRSRVLNSSANAALLLISVVVALGFLEFAVRLGFPIYDPSGQVRFTQLPDGTPIGPAGRVLRQIKHTGDYDVEVRFNASGFRDDKPLSSATDVDIFVVGDSFGFGWGVEARDRFSDRLQILLNRPVFNIAIAGTDFDGYDRLIHYARAQGTTVREVIVSVTMENDLHIYGTSQPSALSPKPDSATDAQRLVNFPSLKAYLGRHFALYGMLTRGVHQTPWLRDLAVRSGLLIPNLDGIGDITDEMNTALASAATRLSLLVRGYNAVVLIVPSRRLWVGETAQREDAARIHAAFVDRLKKPA